MRVHPSSALRRLAGWIFLAALLLTSSAYAVDDIVIEPVVGPEAPTGDYKHPASVTELANGDLYVVFFSGKGEYRDDAAAVFGLRLRQGAKRWTRPEAIARNPFHSLGNAVVWQAPDGLVWLFYVTRYGELWNSSRITAKISRDGAKTWSESFMLTFEAGTMVRNLPIVLSNGDYLLPVYHEVGDDPELTGPDCTSFFLRFDPHRKTWTESNRVRSRLGNLQPAPAVISGDHLVAFGRRGGDYEGRPDGWMVRTESQDGGTTWSPGVDSPFPNPNAAVDFLRLQSGNHLLVYNDSFSERTPLTVALSRDGAKTFPEKRNLLDRPNGDYAYPTAIQTRDGRIQVFYTAERKKVMRAIFREEAVGRR